MKKILIFFLVSFFLVLNINPVFAPDVDLTEFDDRLGNALGIGAFGGGLILSFFVVLLFIGFIAVAAKRQPSTVMVLFIGIVGLSMCIAFTWFPVMLLVLMVLLVSFLFGGAILKKVR